MKKLIALIGLVSILGWGNVFADHHFVNISAKQCSVAPGACKRDINVCGNSTDCQCQKGFEYNQATGTCDVVFPATQKPVLAATEGASSYKPLCSFAPPSVCTMDINQCGNPSLCICPLYYVYNPAAGKCDAAFPIPKIPVK